MTPEKRFFQPDRAAEIIPKVETEGFEERSLLTLPLSDFVGDQEQRWKKVAPFLEAILAKYKDPKVLDLATGSGQDSIALLRQGLNVTSNEIDPAGISKAQGLAEQEGLALNLRTANWANMGSSPEYAQEEFDVVYSLGNSFPNYLLDPKQRADALRAFWSVLKPGGTLVFDTRNFDYMIDQREEILADPEQNFRYSYRTNYLGRAVKAFPVRIAPNLVTMLWKNKTKQTYSKLDIWPATSKHVQQLIKEALDLASYQTFYDYKSKRPKDYDFVEYVLQKPVKAS